MSAPRSTHPGRLSRDTDAWDPRGPGALGRGDYCLHCTTGPARIGIQGSFPLPWDPQGSRISAGPAPPPQEPVDHLHASFSRRWALGSPGLNSSYLCVPTGLPGDPTCHHLSLVYGPYQILGFRPPHPWASDVPPCRLLEVVRKPYLSEVFVLATSGGSPLKTPVQRPKP